MLELEVILFTIHLLPTIDINSYNLRILFWNVTLESSNMTIINYFKLKSKHHSTLVRHSRLRWQKTQTSFSTCAHLTPQIFHSNRKKSVNWTIILTCFKYFYNPICNGAVGGFLSFLKLSIILWRQCRRNEARKWKNEPVEKGDWNQFWSRMTKTSDLFKSSASFTRLLYSFRVITVISKPNTIETFVNATK